VRNWLVIVQAEQANNASEHRFTTINGSVDRQSTLFSVKHTRFFCAHCGGPYHLVFINSTGVVHTFTRLAVMLFCYPDVL
jgi:hypothetical protein